MTEKNTSILKTELVTGHCPACTKNTILVGLQQSFYRCTNCGADLHQHKNGKISYIPTSNNDAKNYDMYLKDWM